MILEEQKLIADKFGLDSRENLLLEEMGELTQAICKQKRKRGYEKLSESPTEIIAHIVEEIADVENLIDQVKYLLKCEDDVEKVKYDKIKRTLKRIVVYDTKRNNSTKECDCLLP